MGRVFEAHVTTTTKTRGLEDSAHPMKATVSGPEQPTAGTWYFVSMANMHTDGTILVPATSVNEGQPFGGVTIVEPDDANYALWLWLIANREAFPEVNPTNAAAVLQAFHQSQVVKEAEQKVTEDHGLPDC